MAELEAYYKGHADAFRSPEQARIEYVVLDLAALSGDAALPEADLRQYYEQNKARFTAAEQRRARHILIQADKDKPKAERDKAKAKAEKLLEQARRDPKTFADLAKSNSDDPGSAAIGGDLGFFARGAMVKPFEDAAYALKPGEISPVVETDYGYHIIQLEAVQGGDTKAFEAVRPEIERDVRLQQAQRRWAESAEQFSNTVYEQSDSLKPVIDKFKLKLQTATVTRQAAPGAAGPLASAKLLESIFGNDSLKQKRNTDAVEVGPQQMVSARVLEHMPARVRPLDEVREEVRNRVALEQAQAQATKAGEALLARLKTEAAAVAPTLQPAVTVSRDQPGNLQPEVLNALLAADPAKLPQAVGVALPGEGYVVALVEAVLPRQMPPEQAAALTVQLAAALGRAEAQAFDRALAVRFKAEKKVDPIAAAAAASGAR